MKLWSACRLRPDWHPCKATDVVGDTGGFNSVRRFCQARYSGPIVAEKQLALVFLPSLSRDWSIWPPMNRTSHLSTCSFRHCRPVIQQLLHSANFHCCLLQASTCSLLNQVSNYALILIYFKQFINLIAIIYSFINIIYLKFIPGLHLTNYLTIPLLPT